MAKLGANPQLSCFVTSVNTYLMKVFTEVMLK